MSFTKEKYWIHIALWSFMVLFISDYHWFEEISWLEALMYSIGEVLTYAALFYTALFLHKQLRKKPILLILSIGLCILLYILFIRLSRLEFYFYEAEGLRNLYSIILNAVLFTGLAILFGETFDSIHLKQKNLVLQATNQQMQLANLKARINPHFIFNTLNNLNALIVKKDKNLLNFLNNFSTLLRYSIDDGAKKKISLSKELDCVKAYMRLVEMQEPLTEDIDLYIEGSPENQQIIPFIITSLVENAIKHSNINTDKKAHLHIQVSVGDSNLVITIDNSFEKKSKTNESQGIQLIREQLRLSYGNDYELNITEQITKHYCQLIIPTSKLTTND